VTLVREKRSSFTFSPLRSPITVARRWSVFFVASRAARAAVFAGLDLGVPLQAH
jgi:hypothetical protein